MSTISWFEHFLSFSEEWTRREMLAVSKQGIKDSRRVLFFRDINIYKLESNQVISVVQFFLFLQLQNKTEQIKQWKILPAETSLVFVFSSSAGEESSSI